MRPAVPTSKICFLWRIAPFDFLWAVVSPFVALALRDPALFDSVPDGVPHGYQYAAVTIGFAIPVFLFFRLGEGMSRFFSLYDLREMVAATFAIVGLSSLTLFMINRLEAIPRSTPVIYGLVLLAGLVAGRVVAVLFVTTKENEREKTKAVHVRRVILAGVDRFGGTAIRLTQCQRPRVIQIVAALDQRRRLLGRTINGVRIVGLLADLESVVEEYAVHGIEVDEVWVSQSASPGEFAEIERLCRARGVKALAIAGALNLESTGAATFQVSPDEAQLVAPNAGYFRFKRMVDASVAFILLVLLSPLLLFGTVVTFFDVGAPIIFWQRRIGQGGREFMVLKFRTYRAAFDRKGERVSSEARLSRVGRAVRATRLDELPQLFNILRGDMSLIGPRPLLPVDQPADPRLRLLVRPGVTGWAQVNGGTLVTPEEKDALDVWYIHHASFMLDIVIVVRTLSIVFRGESKEIGAIRAALGWYAKMCETRDLLFARSRRCL